MKRRLVLNVEVRESAAVFKLKLLSEEDETLLYERDALLILNLSLDVVDGVGRLDLESDRLAGEGLDEDLHATTESKDEMESGLFLDVVIAEGAAVFELLTSEDEALLIGRDALLVLDLGLDIVNGV